MLDPMRLCLAPLATLLATAPVMAETIAVIGSGEDVAAELARTGHEVLGPTKIGELLDARRRARFDFRAARALASEGRERLVGANFPAAIDRLSRAAGEFLATGAPPLDELARVYMDLAIAHIADGSTNEAQRHMMLALRLDATLDLDSSHGPGIRRVLDRVRGELARARRARRGIVRTEPAAASIAVDGRERGWSPLVLADLPLGSHLITARAPGYRAVAVRVEVEVHREAPVVVPLEAETPSPLQAALDALYANDLEVAAARVREALGTDSVVAVQSVAGGLHALLLSGEGPPRHVEGRDAPEVMRELFPPPVLPVAIRHRPPRFVIGRPLNLEVRLEGASERVADMIFAWRQGRWRELRARPRGQVALIVLPASAGSSGELVYHIRALGPAEEVLASLGSAESPLRVAGRSIAPPTPWIWLAVAGVAVAGAATTVLVLLANDDSVAPDFRWTPRRENP